MTKKLARVKNLFFPRARMAATPNARQAPKEESGDSVAHWLEKGIGRALIALGECRAPAARDQNLLRLYLDELIRLGTPKFFLSCRAPVSAARTRYGHADVCFRFLRRYLEEFAGLSASCAGNATRIG
ncbi:MAG: hypothetical protein LBG69_01660 [Zoogloeaceae bacterium]|nr:hypothetical protein [Zoogloeaceae bacterium]